jgi:hypothetical protein
MNVFGEDYVTGFYFRGSGLRLMMLYRAIRSSWTFACSLVFLSMIIEGGSYLMVRIGFSFES